MAKKRPAPVITHTELLCLAYRALKEDVIRWEKSLAITDQDELTLAMKSICADQFRKMSAIRQLYYFETGTEFCD